MREDYIIDRSSSINDINNPVQYSIRWPAIFAGAFVALLVYATLTALGLAFGGATLSNVAQGESSAETLGIGAGVWTVLSVLVSLFAGAFVSGRVGGLVVTRVGRIQGLVVASLFFAFLFSSVGSMVGSLGSGLSSAASSMGGTASTIAQSSQVQGVVDKAMGDLNLQVPSEEVIGGIVSRLIRGDEEGALTYFSRQAGISREDAQSRIQSVRAELDQAITAAGDAAGDAIQAAGWVIFGALLLGSLAAMLGGGLGAQYNLRTPLSDSDRTAILDKHVA